MSATPKPIPATKGAADTCASLRERKKQATREAIHTTAFNLVVERGTADVTVEEICEAVGISARTFFNYYPTKLDAAFDTFPVQIPPERAAAFLAGDGDLVSDAVALISTAAKLPSDYERIRSLLRDQPDLVVNFWKQTVGRLRPVHELIGQRAPDAATARLAFGIVVIAALSWMIRSGKATDTTDVNSQLLAEIAQMRALLLGSDPSALA